MTSWRELAKLLRSLLERMVRLIKARRSEEAPLGFAAILFWVGHSVSGWLTPEITEFLKSWHGLPIFQSVFYAGGLAFLAYGGYRVSKLFIAPDLPPPTNRSSAIKGPNAFTPEDGELFRKLGRETELQELLGYIQDDHVRMIVVMGASGVGKTSLLRAGLSNILADKNIQYHYWEAVPSDSAERLLRVVKETWNNHSIEACVTTGNSQAQIPSSLEDLINPSAEACPRNHVIVLDQFEQLRGREKLKGIIFRTLRKIAREARPPYRITWIIAFRREFRDDWSDFIIPENKRGFYPPESLVSQFTEDQARNVIGQIIKDANLGIEESVINDLLQAAAIKGEISPVDIGIGLMVLAELYEKQGGRTVTADDYRFAGGAEGLLTQYVDRSLERLPESDRDNVLKILLALRDPQTNQRLSEGLTVDEIASAVEISPAEVHQCLNRLRYRDIRLVEIVSSADVHVTRYRLPHERLIPAIEALASKLLAIVVQAKLKLDKSFLIWTNNARDRRLLLRGRDLRLVNRHHKQIPWDDQIREKRQFLMLSRRRRSSIRLLIVTVVLLLVAAMWILSAHSQKSEHLRFLTESGYPPELYDWQNRLKTLTLLVPLDLERWLWLSSTSIEHLEIRADQQSNSIAGLASLSQCNSLTHLTLDLSHSQVADLTPVGRLKRLTGLTLILGGSQVTDLTPLLNLESLTSLALDLNHSKVSDLTPLSELTARTRLRLHLGLGRVSNTLQKLSSLSELSVIVGPEVLDLTPLEELPTSVRLTVSLPGRSEMPFTILDKLSSRPQLVVDLAFSNIRDLRCLEKLTSLTDLTLVVRGIKSVDLTSLEKLSALTKLTLDLRESQGTDLRPLEQLSPKTQLDLFLGSRLLSDLDSLKKLKSLSQLTLELSGQFMSGPRTPLDLSGLEALSSLTRLNIDFSHRPVEDLTWLERVGSLNDLTLNLNESLVKDLTPLKTLKSLNRLTLFLGRSLVSDLTPLEELSSVTKLTLNLNEGRLNDLSSLERMGSLRQLNLDLIQSKMNNFSSLEKLNGLVHLGLGLGDGETKNLAYLNNITSLRRLDLTFGVADDGLAPFEKLQWPEKSLVGPATRAQRLALHELPKNVVQLRF